ncbi:MAG TPA: HPF/RaiA family ribosome-associated protein [Candidatus Acidoferrum sp.]|nr:HPF/RaiA family ribosome-associated protein [Candidatus Acidoferrum sp.]
MQLPLQITFRNMEASGAVQGWIEEEAARLESLYRPIMRCHVTVEVPHRHHKKGAQYHVRIDLTVPGGEIVIKHQPSARGRALHSGKRAVTKVLEVGVPHKNLRQAIDDAFKAAARRLQDYARRQNGRVKAHQPASVARVSQLLADKGYGFLTTPDGREIYFHRDSVLNQAFDRLKVGAAVAFAEEQGEKGPQASTVRVVRKGGSQKVAAAAAAS